MMKMIFKKPLTQEEEQQALMNWQNGTKEEKDQARKKLITHNQRLVSYIANRYKSQRYEIDDLISIGTIGLIKAVETFAPDKGVKFSTYSSRCIQNEIFMHLRKTKKQQQEVSMETTLHQDQEGNQLNILDLQGTDKEEIESQVEEQDTIVFILNLIETLHPEERDLICHRFGIGTKAKRQKEVAELLNISQSYVSRIEKKVLRKIKQKYEREQIACEV